MASEFKKVTLSDVAGRVGVSAITVSRALRTPDKVSVRLREEIASAIADLGYVPDPAARALASSRTDVIGVVIPSVTNNVFSDVLLGMYTAIEETPFYIQLGNTRYSALKEENLLRLFLRQKPAGLIVTGIDQSETSQQMLEAAPCPVVQIMEINENPIDLMIGFSHYEAARMATRHMAEQGYRKPAFVGARMDPRSQRRFRGFRDAAAEVGLFSEKRVITTATSSSVSLGAQLFGELIGQAPEADAVFCNNDDLALGVLFEAQRRRIAVPERLGICGFNDFEMMAAAEPPVTSVRTFRNEMGRRAVEMLVEAIDAPGPRERQVIDLGYEIRKRRSTEGRTAA
ncbi:LacI family DNA-binding transcriptional regulator [Chelativorans sp. M5D2P16]|uniref:LacI family DNA-binding transcriptional regulator n=1 Tax=Chelativorans sp. M5D2P16 TaxID=3095678 RepID=UPI002ACA50FD|nr:LacI family DNA-binding transcriptional regulator [Chelativorans sp. M5D2P16]MDZ5699523.1 LacI family DNA-binding transcriptional regulator [Chelativorans sp. M5D2P16]